MAVKQRLTGVRISTSIRLQVGSIHQDNGPLDPGHELAAQQLIEHGAFAMQMTVAMQPVYALDPMPHRLPSRQSARQSAEC
ncbi:hypothetical protein ELS24_17515 [Achromobacter spanius]|uniref:hypothetical protein n=1 Tax=Achromobacter spanius TaxID=217203 RepID=UPI000F8FA15F|nr:hypothetical protein [Achromobacter spanius]AZS80095.1 hypothetical protein ELS24_17515 [Achromobacter spanius]